MSVSDRDSPDAGADPESGPADGPGCGKGASATAVTMMSAASAATMAAWRLRRWIDGAPGRAAATVLAAWAETRSCASVQAAITHEMTASPDVKRVLRKSPPADTATMIKSTPNNA